MGVRFGTDGIRGVANDELSAELALAVGRAAARHLGTSAFLVGRDPRRSGQMLLGALAAGVAAEGVDVVDLGVLPTPALAYLAAHRQLPGAMVSASHNPWTDNGIKLFSATGAKLPDALEARIGAEIDALLADGERPRSSKVGVVGSDPDAIHAYEEHLLSAVALGTRPLRVVCDCANGAASLIAPEVLRRAGLDVVVIGDQPDGVNINAGVGSTALGLLQEAVVAHVADLGVAFDGDADRCLAVDERGDAVDGDALMALLALDLHERCALAGPAVVVTVMSNLGLRRSLHRAGIEVVECAVGDRYILEALERRGLNFGGEQSGHLVFFEQATTGDGLLTALKLLELCSRRDAPLSVLARDVIEKVPQGLANVPAEDPRTVAASAAVLEAVRLVESELGEDGRVLVRPSGTEPLVRVMVEAIDAADAKSALDRLVAAVEAAAGGPS